MIGLLAVESILTPRSAISALASKFARAGPVVRSESNGVAPQVGHLREELSRAGMPADDYSSSSSVPPSQHSVNSVIWHATSLESAADAASSTIIIRSDLLVL
jgi:hypothetical protein